MNQPQLQACVDKQISNHIKNIVVHLQSVDESLNLIAAAGIANPHEQSPMMPDTPYFMASISKTYTAIIIMKLYEVWMHLSPTTCPNPSGRGFTFTKGATIAST